MAEAPNQVRAGEQVQPRSVKRCSTCYGTGFHYVPLQSNVIDMDRCLLFKVSCPRGCSGESN